MQYLVTGGAGFIGSNTVDELVRRGHGVTVLDDLSAGKEANLEKVGSRSPSFAAVLPIGRRWKRPAVARITCCTWRRAPRCRVR